MFQFVCLMMSGMPLTNEIRLDLVVAGFNMLLLGSNNSMSTTGAYTAEIRTGFRRAALGTFVGIVFEAEVESSRGQAKVRFLLDPSPLERNRNATRN